MENKKMNIVYKKVKDLIPYENNPRNNDEAVDYVAKSIEEFGFKVPCVVSGDGVLITGHTRLKACKKLGIDEVPCIVADDLQYFHMRMNDDITTSLINGMRGKLYYTYMPVMVYVDPTQVQHGGMTDIYKKNGTYRKSFYSVMCCPSCVKVSAMGITEYRIHHEISWNNAVPKLLSERWCKHERH